MLKLNTDINALQLGSTEINKAYLGLDVVFEKGLPLIMTIDTTKGDGLASFAIPTSGSEVYNYSVDWGDENNTSGHTGNATHTYSASGVYQITIKGKFPKFYFNNGGDKLKLISIDQWGDIDYSTDQLGAFRGCINLNSLADDIEWINGITNGAYMFGYNSLTSLPSGMTLSSLTSGINMFSGNSLTSLPSGMTLSSLTIGFYMFSGNSLKSLPSTMALSSLTNGSNMFGYNSLTSLPSTMTLSSLTNGDSLFRNNSLTSLPSTMTLSSLTNGINMFNGNTINTSDYSTLINNIDANNTNANVIFHGGNSKYNSTAVNSHDNLTNVKNWVITDGGLEV